MRKKKDEIKKNINQLKFIKDNIIIIIYHESSYQDIINRIIEVIKNNQDKRLKDYNGGKIGDLIKETESLRQLAEKINEIKHLLFFNVIYSMNSRKM